MQEDKLAKDVRRLLMTVNPRAGRTKSREPLFDAAAVLSEAGYLLSIHNTSAPGDAQEYITRHGAAFDTVVAVGGDGTLHEAVCALMCMDHPPYLGYLPQGSTNDFASSLGLSVNAVEAARTIAAAQPRSLDIGQWNDRFFVYVASFGAFTRSSYSASQSAKNALGHFAYLLEGVQALDTLRPYRVRLDADGETFDGEYLFGAVCNSTSIGGVMKLDSNGVILDDGLFELLLIPNPRTPAELQTFMLALMNQEYNSPSLIFRHAARIRVETDEDFPWTLDGEYAPGASVVEIRNRRQALAMLL